MCGGYPPDRKGGVETIVSVLCNLLSGRGYDCRVVTRRWSQTLVKPGVDQISTPEGEAKGYAMWAFKAIKRVASLRPDIIHCHGLEGAIVCSLLRFSSAKTFMHIHNSLSREAGFMKNLRHRLGYLVLREACITASAVICPTEVVKQDVIRHIPTIEQDKIRVVPNFAADPSPWAEDRIVEFRRQLNVASKRVLLYFGKVKRSKGIEEICEAYEMLPNKEDIALVVAGGATATERFLELLKARYPDVIFTGYVDDPSPYYQIADVFCIYTSGFEGGETFAISLAESMRYGVPVVCADNPIFREVTRGFAFFAPAKRPRILADRIQEAIREGEVSRKMGRGAKLVADEYYSPNAFLDSIVHAYSELSGHSARSKSAKTA